MSNFRKAKIGDIYLINNRGPISSLIRFWTRSSFNHAGIVTGRNKGTEADFWKGGVVEVDLTHEYKKARRVEILRPKKTLTRIEVKNIRQYLADKLGAEYDFKAILGFIISRKIQKRRKFYCFELVYKAYEYTGRELFRLDKGYIDAPLIYSSNDLDVIEKE